MDLWIIPITFLLGFAASRVGLPPLIGYLGAGFALHAAGYEATSAVEFVADIGVLLLLFGIGLKLRLGELARREVWAVAGIHMSVATAVIGALFLALGALGLPLAATLTPGSAILIGFAFSFSSTVFAVKALEERSEAASLSGRVAIGVLVVQDLVAVAFLTLSAGTAPSIWTVAVVGGILAARPILGWVLDRTGHGELIVLFGLAMAVGIGAESFEAVGIKPDLGALVAGMVISRHPRAAELSDQLLGLKDLLLIGFFLSIGLGGAPDASSVVVAAVAMTLLAVKTAGFLQLLARFHLRARTSLHTSLTLTTFSEFGLIVAAAGVDRGFIDQRWLAAVAVAVAASFAVAAILNEARYALYGRWSQWLIRRERLPIQAEDALVEPTAARVVVFGMGRVGTGAFDELAVRIGGAILGVDRDDETVESNRVAGRNVIRGDALDRDFWERLRLRPGLRLAILAMSDHHANLEAARRVREYLPDIRIAATARYPDQVVELREVGVDVARNLYLEAGQGLADDAATFLESEL